MELKLVAGTLGAIITFIAYAPYLKDIFAKETKPHIYSWLVWSITLSTAAFAALEGGGLHGSITLFASAALTIFVTLVCLKYGSKDITRADTLALISAIAAVLIWWQLDNPLLAIIIVILIDAVGYLPTIRKTWKAPSSETPLFWYMIAVAGFLAIVASEEYNLLSIGFLLMYTIANIIVASISKFKKT